MKLSSKLSEMSDVEDSGLIDEEFTVALKYN